MNSLNKNRVRRCDRALRRYDTDSDLCCCLIDFLADARHWCDHHGRDYAKLDRIGRDHYLEEAASPRKEVP
jgi:hypothetical protein